MKSIYSSLLVCGLLLAAGSAYAQANPDAVTSTGAGTFTDFGYNPRGEAMGGAMVAVISGEFQYAGYNPAIAGFQDGYRATFSYSALDLDRTLNFVAISGPLATQAPPDTTETGIGQPAAKRNAAAAIRIQLGWLRAGVGNIQAYDYEGDKIGTLSSSENEFFGGASVRINPKFSLGFAARFYHSTLPYPDQNFPSISSSGFGLDIGMVYAVRDNLTFGAAIQHIAAKYHWDSSSLYGQLGSSTTDYFPITFRAGASYRPVQPLLLAIDASIAERLYDTQDNFGNKVSATGISFGAEYELAHELYLRGGIKGVDLINSLRNEITESLGFGYTFSFEGWQPSISYALLSNSVTPGPSQMIAVGVRF